MEQYSNLTVHGKIKQKTAQGEQSDDVVLYPTLTTRVPAAIPQPNQAGKAIIVNDQGTGYILGEAGKVDQVQINGVAIAGDGTQTKIANIPIASANDLGVIKVGTNLSINSSGVLSATDTTYSAGTGISFNGTTINHSNSISAGTAGTSSATSGATIDVPYITYDAQGHITGKGTHVHTITNLPSSALPDASTTAKGAVILVRAENLSPADTSITVPTEAKMEQFVNSSIATNTAYFLGTYDVESLGLTDSATHAQVVTKLNAKTSWEGGRTPSNNDYCFVYFDLSQDPGNVDKYERYKYDGTTWAYEYTLNNSSFTSAQWATINSLVTNSSVGTNNPRGIDVTDILSHIADTTIHTPVSELVKDVKVGTNSVVNSSTRIATIPIAGSSTLGAVKTGYTTSGKDYAIAADANGNLHVSVPWTDVSVDSVSHHYTPTATDANKITVSASGGSASWNTSVISGFTVSRDAAGHVTAITPTSVKIPSNPNTDTKVTQVLKTDDYNRPLLMSDQVITTTTASVTGEASRNNSIYANTSTGRITANGFVGLLKGKELTYTVPSSVTTGKKVLARYTGTYAGAPGHVRFKLECTSSNYSFMGIIDVTWGKYRGNIILLNGNGNYEDINYLYLSIPFPTDYSAYPPTIGINNSTTAEKNVKITILESTEDITWSTNWNTTYTSYPESGHGYENEIYLLYGFTGGTSGWASGNSIGSYVDMSRTAQKILMYTASANKQFSLLGTTATTSSTSMTPSFQYSGGRTVYFDTTDNSLHAAKIFAGNVELVNTPIVATDVTLADM